MKLLHLTTRNFLISTMLILSVTGVLLYFVIRTLVEKEMIEQLDLQADMIADELKQGRTVSYPLVKIEQRALKENDHFREIGDTLIYDYVGKEYEDYRFLRVSKTAAGHSYLITVMLTYIGWQKYYQVIFFLLAGAAVLLGLAGVLLNYLLSRKLWKPFFFNLKQLKHYSLSRPEQVNFQDSLITEFKEMKASLEELTDRSRREYLALREFTENASHEIQTPLGILQTKLDRMSQMPVDEAMATYIVQAKAAVDRLRKVSKGLLLLARLENDVFTPKEQVAVDQLVRQLFEQMEDLFAGKNITVSWQVAPCTVTASRFLVEVLVSNFLANALHYTPQGGKLEVVILPLQIQFSNTGAALSFPAEQLFDRFKKGDQHSQSTGLGLAIVKQICYVNNWRVDYSYNAGAHSFRVAF